MLHLGWPVVGSEDRRTLIGGSAMLQVRSVTDEQMTRFLNSWYPAFQRPSTGAMGDDVRLRVESSAEVLLHRRYLAARGDSVIHGWI